MVEYAESKPEDTYRIYMYDTNYMTEFKDVAWCDWEPKTTRNKMPGVFELKKP